MPSCTGFTFFVVVITALVDLHLGSSSSEDAGLGVDALHLTFGVSLRGDLQSRAFVRSGR